MKVAVSSGKGGTGKTTLAVNLASFLSENHRVILTDLDVEEPDSGLFINGELFASKQMFREIPSWIEDRCTPCDICHEVCNYNAVIRLREQILVFPEICHSCYACVELCPANAMEMIPHKIGMLNHYKAGNMDLIESVLEIGAEQPVPLIKQALSYINQKFHTIEFIIFDTPPGTSCPVIESVKEADKIILVTEPTPFGLHDLILSVEVMKKLGKEFAVVINRDGIGNDETDEFCMQEGIEIIARIPNDRKIAEVYSEGGLLYKVIPGFREQLNKITDYILQGGS